MAKNKEISYKQEILRKSIHLFSLSFPIIYYFITRDLALKVLIPMTIIAVVLDLLSKRKGIANKIIYGIFGKMLRAHETEKKFTLNGASWVLISATTCVLIFPKMLMITGFSILIISDISAALYGRRYGKHKFFDKSYEGSAAFVVSAIIVVAVIGWLTNAPLPYYVIGWIACFFGAWAEAASGWLRVDDNMSIPLSVGGIMWIGNIIGESFGFTFL